MHNPCSRNWAPKCSQRRVWQLLLMNLRTHEYVTVCSKLLLATTNWTQSQRHAHCHPIGRWWKMAFVIWVIYCSQVILTIRMPDCSLFYITFLEVSLCKQNWQEQKTANWILADIQGAIIFCTLIHHSRPFVVWAAANETMPPFEKLLTRSCALRFKVLLWKSINLKSWSRGLVL